MPWPSERFPYGELEQWLIWRYARRTARNHEGHPQERYRHLSPQCEWLQPTADEWLLTDSFVAEVCGVTRRSVQRWKTEGLTVQAADHAAVNLGGHIGLIWDQWWEVAS